MKKELLLLQEQRDCLRSKLQSKSRFGLFDQEWEDGSKELRKLDGLFFRLCESSGLELSSFGRLLR